MNLASDEYIANAFRRYIAKIDNGEGNIVASESAVDGILETHEMLRKWNFDNQKFREEYTQTLRGEMKENISQSVVDEFIHEKLRHMTLQEVANYIGENDG